MFHTQTVTEYMPRCNRAYVWAGGHAICLH